MLTQALRNILQLLLYGQVVKTLANRELSVDAFLGDVEVLHVEETILPHALDECLCELFLALRRAEETEVQSDEICPFEIFLQRQVCTSAYGQSKGHGKCAP